MTRMLRIKNTTSVETQNESTLEEGVCLRSSAEDELLVASRLPAVWFAQMITHTRPKMISTHDTPATRIPKVPPTRRSASKLQKVSSSAVAPSSFAPIAVGQRLIATRFITRGALLSHVRWKLPVHAVAGRWGAPARSRGSPGRQRRRQTLEAQSRTSETGNSLAVEASRWQR